MSKTKLYKYYGVLKSDILTIISPGLTAKELHSWIKNFLRVDSFKTLTKQELYDCITELIAYFASEYGIELPLSEEGKTMKEKLEWIS